MDVLHHSLNGLKGRPLAADGVIALLLGGLTLVTFVSSPVSGSERSADGLGIILVIIVNAALSWRRLHPVPVLAVVTVLSMILLVLDYSAPHMLAAVVALYSVGAHVDRPRSVQAFAAATATFTIIALIGWSVAEEDVTLPDISWTLAILTTAFVIGDNLRGRRAHLATLEARAVDLEREREQLAQRAVIDERQRIARELHDVVAHTMSVMVVQAGAARRLIDQQPEQARSALQSVETTGRSGLDEMRRLLGVLRTDGENGNGGADYAPQPSLTQLAELVAGCADAGVPVELQVSGQPPELPAGLDLSAYRVVQEALTNTMKHAGPARATVSLDWSPDELTISVIDDGRGAAAVDTGPGHGLLGMSERVDLYGGNFRAGPHPGGGFGVHATFPFAPAGTL
ncbi:MAG: sensor histidine kinase [Actinomycetia bacterium]|nr:sensor histidine kinase [Actinomycetes bacterium]